MSSYVTTPGQRDILEGTYSRTFINRNAMCFAVCAPHPLKQSAVEAAVSEMGKQHPALRMIPEFGASGWRQTILAFEDLKGQRLVSEQVVDEDLGKRMNLLVARMVDEFDIFTRPSWGVIQLRTETEDHIVFVFNHIVADIVAVSHFIRTFIASVTHGAGARKPKDTYLDYLSSLEAVWTDSPAEGVDWWMNRPWAKLPELPGLRRSDETPRCNYVEIVDTVLEEDLRERRLTEESLIRALDRSIRDVTGVSTTRIDAARVARNTHIERFASGWLSHALPLINTDDSSPIQLDSSRERAGSWVAAFHRVRARAELSNEHHMRAQVFVNFFGTFAPHRWSSEGFRMSRMQPTNALPGRSSLTPFHLKVRRGDGRWSFSWSLSPRFAETDLLQSLGTRTRQLLAVR